MSWSPDSGISCGSSDDGLPSSSYNGSHLSWKSFRHGVLAPHRIKILEDPPKEAIPTTLLDTVEAESQNAAKYEGQKRRFRDQVEKGRGFGPSPLFPPNLLPPVDTEAQLARCMVPSFSGDALPERALNQMGPLYELSIPRSGLGCGFASNAFTAEELAILPSWLVCAGTDVHFDTGYISPGAALYCPFLIFERAWGNKEHPLETANNQCAIGGAWCVKALQMLYGQAWKEQMVPELPVAFSCSIDNTFAVLNLHWVDHGQAYCMSPLCKFDLSKDDHLSSFLVWVDSIGRWGKNHLLPLIKAALERLRLEEDIPPATPRANPKLSLDTDVCPNDQIIKSLKTNFENIPWRFEDDEFTPVSSSTASWGSPMLPDLRVTIPNVPQHVGAGATPTSTIQRKQYLTGLGQHPTPPPVYAHNPELVWQKRFGHAMDEIRDLQRQLQTLRSEVNGSNASFQTELSTVRTTMESVLRKETFSVRNRSLSLNMQETWTTSGVQKSPLANEVLPEHVIDRVELIPRSPIDIPRSPKCVPKSLSLDNGPTSPGIPSPSMMSPGMPSPAFTVFSETTNILTVPPAPPKAASLFKFASVMVSGHMISLFIPNMLLRIFVLGAITDVCMLAFASPHLPSSAEYLLSLWRSR
jgi:hypothetical protein